MSLQNDVKKLDCEIRTIRQLIIQTIYESRIFEKYGYENQIKQILDNSNKKNIGEICEIQLAKTYDLELECVLKNLNIKSNKLNNKFFHLWLKYKNIQKKKGINLLKIKVPIPDSGQQQLLIDIYTKKNSKLAWYDNEIIKLNDRLAEINELKECVKQANTVHKSENAIIGQKINKIIDTKMSMKDKIKEWERKSK